MDLENGLRTGFEIVRKHGRVEANSGSTKKGSYRDAHYNLGRRMAKGVMSLSLPVGADSCRQIRP